ncbi:MAG: putative zinc transporter msc2 [Geoglossum umbratile]|nr:MAG: putative zinc transporter msc2 [Geoglossum umbratile]
MLVQTFYGIATGSLGLLSDSVHMLFDCLALLVGLCAAVMSKWPPSMRFPYGLGKIDTLAGFANGIFLMLISIEIVIEAIERLVEGSEMRRIGELLTISSLGLGVNLVGLFAFDHAHHGHGHTHSTHNHDVSHHHSCNEEHSNHKHSHATAHGHGHHHHSNENMHGIFLHVLADTLGSVAVVVSTLLIKYFGWAGFDPLASCLIAILIFASAIPLVSSSAKTLLLTIPADTEYKLRETLAGVSGLRGVVGYCVPRFWLEDATGAADAHGPSCASISGADGTMILGVIHVIISKGADVKEAESRIVAHLNNSGLSVVVQIEREGERYGVNNQICGVPKARPYPSSSHLPPERGNIKELTMLQDIKLPFSPRVQDCMSWSADGDIAIAAGDCVQIMSPKPIYKALYAKRANRTIQTHYTDQWELSSFKASDFSEEAQEFGHAGFDIFSIGEEQSAASVSCISWSPPGIARYRRCILAVLSTTHILSLFESPSSGLLFGGWRRVLVVNTAVKDYFGSLQKGDDGPRFPRLRRRIRAFGWSFESRFDRKDDGTTSQFFLALANEYNEIIFARICFDGYHPARPGGTWSAQITGHMQVHPADTVGMRFESSLPTRLSRFVNNLSWSPWYETKNGRNEAFVAYSTRGELKVMNVSVTAPECQLGERAGRNNFGFQIGDQGVTVTSAFSEKYHISPLAWYEKVWNERLILAFAAPGSIQVASVMPGLVHHHSITKLPQEAITVKEYPNKYWDSVTGIALRVDPNNSEVLTIHIVTQLSHTFILRYSFPEANLYASAPPAENDKSWAQAISSHLASFDSRHNLGGLALAKTWGLARSPMGGFIAVCFTLHPKGMIEYAIRSNESCRVVFGIEQDVLECLVQLGEDGAKPGILELSIEAFVQDARHLEGPPGLGIAQNAQRPTLKPLEQLWKRLYRAIAVDDGQNIDVNWIT